MGSEKPLGFFGVGSRSMVKVDERELAELVGRVVIRAAQVEHALEVLTFEKVRDRSEGDQDAPVDGRGPAKDRSGISGLSGKALASELRSAGLGEFADRYINLGEKRNAVVHGLWSIDVKDMVGLVTTRTKRKAASIGDVRQDEWTPGTLEQLREDLELMLEDVGDLVLDLARVPAEVPRSRDSRPV